MARSRPLPAGIGQNTVHHGRHGAAHGLDLWNNRFGLAVFFFSHCRRATHACGHDGHTAILLGTAMVLAQLRKSLAGKIKFIFQPAEEGGLGAKMMCGRGVLKNPDVDAIFALHGWPELKCGTIGIGKDRVSASSNRFSIVVVGRESHGATPEKGIDTVLIAARIVEGLQAIASRQISPLNPVVVTIGSIHGGSAGNTIPGRVELSGTIRYFDDKTRNFIFKSINRISNCTARALGGGAKVIFEPDVPATINHPKMVEILMRAAKKILKPGNMSQSIPPEMIGEDFAFYLKEAPGAYFFLGLAEKSRRTVPLHNARFDFNDHALVLGMQMMAQTVLEFLGNHNAT